MSLREPQYEALVGLDEISNSVDYKTAHLDSVAGIASEKSKSAKPVQFDTQFPSFCFALATGVGKTRLMGGCMYYLWKSKGYRNFFILAPNITIYEKLRAELSPAHPKYMFVGLSDFPRPDVVDGENYLRFNLQKWLFEENQCRVFIFNISKIFTARTDTEFKFHRFNENLGNSFSAILQEMDDLVILMDESHRYRGEKSLKAINYLKPVLVLDRLAEEKKILFASELSDEHRLNEVVKGIVAEEAAKYEMAVQFAAEPEKLKEAVEKQPMLFAISGEKIEVKKFDAAALEAELIEI